jgi:hypothetical protein
MRQGLAQLMKSDRRSQNIQKVTHSKLMKQLKTQKTTQESKIKNQKSFKAKHALLKSFVTSLKIPFILFSSKSQIHHNFGQSM